VKFDGNSGTVVVSTKDTNSFRYMDQSIVEPLEIPEQNSIKSPIQEGKVLTYYYRKLGLTEGDCITQYKLERRELYRLIRDLIGNHD